MLAVHLDRHLYERGKHSFVLDGDPMRTDLSRDLAFSETERREHIRRVCEVARLMADAGLMVIVSIVSPFRKEQVEVRPLFSDDLFIEVYVSTPLAECERRDVKGLYGMTRRGLVSDLTGVNGPCEPPLAPQLQLDTSMILIDSAVEKIICILDRK